MEIAILPKWAVRSQLLLRTTTYALIFLLFFVNERASGFRRTSKCNVARRHFDFGGRDRSLRISVQSEPSSWSTSNYRKPVHWVQKVAHLEDTLKFYEENFGFAVYRHEEFATGCEATCNGPYGGAWSKTMIGPGSDESKAFCLELVHNYGIHRYEHGNDIRLVALKEAAFIGDDSSLGRDESGRKFLKTPDGYWIKLEGDEENEGGNRAFNNAVDHNKVVPQNDKISYVSIHVSDIEASIKYYRDVLGASVVMSEGGQSAMCRWDNRGSSAQSELEACNVGVQLHVLPEGQSLVFGESQGRFAIETEDGAVARMADRARVAEAAGTGRIIHGPIKLEPHGEEVVIVGDPDGHEYCFVDARGFRSCIDVARKPGGSTVDWAYRQKINDKAFADFIGDRDFGPHIKSIDASMYEEVLAETTGDIVLDLYAPWCVICGRNKIIYKELAKRVAEIAGDKITFVKMDATRVPFSSITDETLNLMLMYAKKQGFPALFYLPKDARDIPEEFPDGWTIKELRSWIETHCTQPIDLSAMDMSEPYNYNEESGTGAGTGAASATGTIATTAEDDDDDCDKCSL